MSDLNEINCIGKRREERKTSFAYKASQFV